MPSPPPSPPAATATAATPAPAPIRRLDESLINRIAAGEIIHRPASALKELLENALDAGATSIKITAKDGGLKLLQIQDNGSGIRKADLPLLATRFATSKLRAFDDLAALQTYGFRGEALASISHVAHLAVVTKTRADACAWRATYADGVLAPPKPGASADPKPCAGNDGTTVTIENLFYNTPTRLAALRSGADEYARILDVVSRYAVHNPAVAFVCRKAGAPSADVATPAGATVRQTIGLLFGHAVARELVHVVAGPAAAAAAPDDPDKAGVDADTAMSPPQTDDPGGWRADAYVTAPTYHARKFTFLLFINHRLVSSAPLKRALEGAYAGVLPKAAAPFVYLALALPPADVDVNVHPTKAEVRFLHEERICAEVVDKVVAALVRGAGTEERRFTTQTLLPGAAPTAPAKGKGKGKGKARAADADDADEADEEEDADADADDASAATPSTSAAKKKVLSQHKVRTSMRDRTLDGMFPASARTRTSSGSGTPTTPLDADASATPAPSAALAKERPILEADTGLISVDNLRAEVLAARHSHLTEILANHVFVGIADRARGLSLVQHSTKLYLVDHGALVEELFYQLGLRQFGALSHIRLEPAPALRTLLALAIDAEDTSSSALSKSELVDVAVNALHAQRELLAEYFMRITPEGCVETLPRLLRRYTPNLDRLPLFLLRIALQVNWGDEQECFRTFLRELAYFYVPGPLAAGADAAPGDGDDDDSEEARQECWQIEHVLFPAMRRYLVAPKTLLDRDVLQVASLPDLYRVFERC